MLKKILIGLGTIIVIFGAYVAYIMLTTKNHSPAAIASYEGKDLNITVNYCQPYKKGRLIFSESEDALVPYGKKWRTGANEATEITFTNHVKVAGQSLKAGTYSLYTIPDPLEWTVAFNEKLDYWGAGMNDPFDEQLDVLRVKASTATVTSPLEQFTISFSGTDSLANMILAWDNTQVVLPLSLQ
ncbi:MAG: DUF2911 domain-containing protein [Cyclobacteriaceae bacterium]|nr:DUF2911 domain-containing protein [Cyclobacteriaceae bacterium HetDA_MAG_MS6]